MAEVKFLLLADDQIGNQAVLLKDERFVEAAHEQHILDSVGKQLMESSECRF